MPFGDGTGPFGTGPMGMGRSGWCARSNGYAWTNSATGAGFGRGAGRGFGGGRGFGRGAGRGFGGGRGFGRGGGRGFGGGFGWWGPMQQGPVMYPAEPGGMSYGQGSRNSWNQQEQGSNESYYPPEGDE